MIFLLNDNYALYQKERQKFEQFEKFKIHWIIYFCVSSISLLDLRVPSAYCGFSTDDRFHVGLICCDSNAMLHGIFSALSTMLIVSLSFNPQLKSTRTCVCLTPGHVICHSPACGFAIHESGANTLYRWYTW